jgi:hypothetical protein
MSETKACNLNEEELRELLRYHGRTLDADPDNTIERINYLHKRLKTFKEEAPKNTVGEASQPAATGWPTNG